MTGRMLLVSGAVLLFMASTPVPENAFDKISAILGVVMLLVAAVIGWSER